MTFKNPYGGGLHHGQSHKGFAFMKDLELVIKKNGFTYTQVFKNETGYVYSQEGYGRIIAYEAFYHKENNHFNTVSFPGNEAFGIWAWSCATLEGAIKRIGNG